MAEVDLVKIVGGNNVLDSPDVLEEYSRDSSFVPRIRPRCVVKPGNVVEGPAIIESPIATVVIPPEKTARIDRFLNIEITV